MTDQEMLEMIRDLKNRIEALENETGLTDKRETIRKKKDRMDFYLDQGMSKREASRLASNDVHFGRI